MSAPHDIPEGGIPEEAPERTPPDEGYDLYRHKNAADMKTRNWHGLYWARRTADGEYEIRSVPTSLGELSAPGGRMPGARFEELYERVEP